MITRGIPHPPPALLAVAMEIREARGSARLPTRPQPVRTKRGERLFPPAQPTTWEVAYRLGATLRQAQTGSGTPVQKEQSETTRRARPRSHLRRAHWHLFWTGKGKTIPRVRWMPPILVGRYDEIVPTIHPVE